MADNYKILAQATAASIEEASGQNQANIVYTVPANTQAAISSISLINSSNISENYYLGVVKASDLNSSSIVEPEDPFVVVGNSDKGLYSYDGKNWEGMTLPSWANWINVAYGSGRYVAISSNNKAAHSTDGINWTQINMSGPQAIAYGNGKFVIVTFGGSPMYSIDGITWTLGSAPSVNSLEVIYGNNKFVAVGYDSEALYSTDGINWTVTTMPKNAYWSKLTYGNGKFIALKTGDPNDANCLAISENGVDWTLASFPIATYWASLTYGDGIFLAISFNIPFFTGDPVYTATSTDGLTWSLLPNMIPNRQWHDVTYADGIFVAIGGFSGEQYAISYTENAVTWYLSPALPHTTFWRGISYGAPSHSKKTISNRQTIVPNRSIEPNTVDEITGGITLSAGDQIRVYSDSPDLIVQVYGVEIA